MPVPELPGEGEASAAAAFSWLREAADSIISSLDAGSWARTSSGQKYMYPRYWLHLGACSHPRARSRGNKLVWCGTEERGGRGVLQCVLPVGIWLTVETSDRLIWDDARSGRAARAAQYLYACVACARTEHGVHTILGTVRECRRRQRQRQLWLGVVLDSLGTPSCADVIIPRQHGAM